MLCYSWVCSLCSVCPGLFGPSRVVIGVICSVIVAIPGLLLYYNVINQVISYWPITSPRSAVLARGLRPRANTADRAVTWPI